MYVQLYMYKDVYSFVVATSSRCATTMYVLICTCILAKPYILMIAKCIELVTLVDSVAKVFVITIESLQSEEPRACAYRHASA